MTLIGLTLRVQPGKDSLPKLALNKTYFDALTNAGAEVLPIPAFAGARADPYYDMLDGLVIPGGPDVEPARYGAVTRSDANVHTNHDLDDLEFALLDRALRDGMPVLDHDGEGLAGLHRELAANVPFNGFDSWRPGRQADRNSILLLPDPC